MITASQVREILEPELRTRDLFLVDIVVRPGNKIALFIDSMKGVTLNECSTLSRFLESKLDRDKEDFELEVSSPGIDRSLMLPFQYEKNRGKMLDVVKSDGMKISGKLLDFIDNRIVVETEQKAKDSKTGKKKVVTSTEEVKLDEVKSAKIIISIKK